MESFWSSMQIELLNKQKWLRVVELSTAMADYIERTSTTRPGVTAQLPTSRPLNTRPYT